MNSLAILKALPAGYVVEESERGVLALDRTVASQLREAGLLPDSGPRTSESELVGRRPLREIVTADDVFVVRSYVHGGLARWLTGERFADPERPFHELVVSHKLSELGIETPRIVAARARKATGGGWNLDLVSRRVGGLLSLTRLIAATDRGEVEWKLLKRVAEAVGALVRGFHDHGFLHADLTTENMLVIESSLYSDALRFCTLDLDRSVFVSELQDPERRKNLQRLYRCIVRRTSHTQNVSVRGLCACFLRGYEASRERRKADWLALAKSSNRARPLHSIGWLLERVLGESRASAEKGISQRPDGAARRKETQSSD